MPAGRPKFGLETVVVALGSLTNRPLGRPTNRASTYLARYTQAATVDTVAAARYCHKLRQLVFPSCQARALLSLAPWIPVTFVSARERCGVVMRGAHYHHSSDARARMCYTGTSLFPPLVTPSLPQEGPTLGSICLRRPGFLYLRT